MSVQKQKKEGKKNRKFGRNLRKPKTARYNNSRRREYNKYKRILKYNKAQAFEYAVKHNLKI
jgi:hypothetical protein